MSNPDSFSPSSSKFYSDEGERLYQKGQFEGAIQAYSCALKLEPNLPLSHLRLGQSLTNLGQYLEAITHYKQAIKLQPDLVIAHHCLGDALSKVGRYSEGIKSYKKAIELKPNSASVTYLKLGCLLEEQSQLQLEDAIAAYKKAVELDPLVSKNYVKLASILVKVNDFRGAICNYQKAIELDPENLESYYKLGIVLTDRGDYEQAAECFLDALKKYPGYHFAYQGIAYLLEKEGIHDRETIKLCYAGQVPRFLVEKFFQSEKPSICKSFDRSEAVEYISLETEHQTYFTPPKTIHPEIHQSFPKVKNVKEVFVIECKNALAYGDGINSAVITKNGNLIKQVSTGNYDLVFSAIFGKQPLELEEKIVFLPTKFGGGNYYHWMFDTVSRIYLLEKAGINLENLNRFVVYTCKSGFQKEIMKHLGIPETKILESSYSPLIKSQEIVIPSPAYAYPSRWACTFLRKKILGTEALENQPYKRVYISRKKASHRQVVNEEEVIDRLEKKGFEAVVLESMSVLEQARLLSQCEIVISPHGGGLTNLLFCSSGTKVIEIFSRNYINPCYHLLSNNCGLEYYYILADEVRDGAKHDNKSNLLVDIHSIDQILNLTNNS